MPGISIIPRWRKATRCDRTSSTPSTDHDDPRSRAGALRGLYIATILTGSFLLVLVQPMVARMALPRLGGAPAVWNSAMLVYQLLLLGGYAYAHWLDRMAPRRQAFIHLVVLLIAACWLPIGLIGRELPSSAAPVIWAPWLLAESIGPLFLAVSALAPLVQRWFNVASGGDDPYPLYAASNLGSFGGLIAYPLLVDPTFALTGQRYLWSAGYLALIALIALVVGCSTMLPRAVPTDLHDDPVSPRASRQRRTWWIALAAVPSGLMLATSTYITAAIIALPLLWVLPLGLYLLRFTVAFAERRWLADALTRIAPILILLLAGVVLGGGSTRMPWSTPSSHSCCFLSRRSRWTRKFIGCVPRLTD